MTSRRTIATAALVVGLVACGGSAKSTLATNAPTTVAGATTASTTPASTTAAPAATTSAASSTTVNAADQKLAEAATLTLADVPAGWKGTPPTDSPDDPGLEARLATCLGVPQSELRGTDGAKADSNDFSDADGNQVSSSVRYVVDAARNDHTFGIFSDARMPKCLSDAMGAYLQYSFAHPSSPADSIPTGMQLGTVQVSSESFPVIGDKTVAYEMTLPFTISGVTQTIYADLVVSVKGRAAALISTLGIGAQFPTTDTQRYMSLVVGRLTNT